MEYDLQTSGLHLRPCRLADVEALHALWTNESVRRFLFDDDLISSEQALAFVNDSLVNFAARGYGLWLAFGCGADNLIGFVGCVRGEDGIPSLLYGIDPEYCGRGYATEASRVVLSYLMNDLAVAKVKADVDEPNAASIRVLEKLGMRQVHEGAVNGKPLLSYEVSPAVGAV